MSNLISITQNISYLPSSTNPLCCDIVFIKTEKSTWIYDVGSSEDALNAINDISGKKNIVISHFHPDHIYNLFNKNLKYDNLFVSKYTKNYSKIGNVIEADFTVEENPEIKIFQFPSSHAKGCLAILCEDYAFLGDGTYAKEKVGHHTYNAQILQKEIEVLKSLPCKFVCLDHDPNFIQKRESLIFLHKAIYSRKKIGNPLISVEDFFNSNGTVKR